MNEQINKMQYTYTMEYCLAIERNEVLTHAMTWMNLKNIIQTEPSQSRLDII